MRTLSTCLFLGFLLFGTFPARGAGFVCKNYDQLRNFLSPKAWFQKSHEFKKAHLGDPYVELPNRDLARQLVFRFPPFERLGFGMVNKLNWKRVLGRMENSRLKGKPIGWETKVVGRDGKEAWARVRLDYSAGEGAHYNIEVRVPSKSSNGYETHNLSVRFPGSEDDVIRMADQLL